MPSFFDFLDRTTRALEERQRVSYRALQLELGVDDTTLADLRRELVDVRKVALDVDGEHLVWKGAPARVGQAPPILDLPPEPELETASASTPTPPPETEPEPSVAAVGPKARPKSSRLPRFLTLAGVGVALIATFQPWATVAVTTGTGAATDHVYGGGAVDEGELVQLLAVAALVFGLFVGGTSLPRRAASLLVLVLGLSVLTVGATVVFTAQEGDDPFARLARHEVGTSELSTQARTALEPAVFAAIAGGVLITLGGLAGLLTRRRSN